ncbi:hypothetical protein ABBQ38_011095 [Trebouxia sp. C0009 RCD-2024]
MSGVNETDGSIVDNPAMAEIFEEMNYRFAAVQQAFRLQTYNYRAYLQTYSKQIFRHLQPKLCFVCQRC